MKKTIAILFVASSTWAYTGQELHVGGAATLTGDTIAVGPISLSTGVVGSISSVGLATASLRTDLTATALSTGTIKAQVDLAGVLGSSQTWAGRNLFQSTAAIVLNAASASLPVQTDAHKNLVTTAIDLSGSQAAGTMAAARMPALTGDITTSAGAVATTLTNSIPNIHNFSGAVTNTSSVTVRSDFGVVTGTATFGNAIGLFDTTVANINSLTPKFVGQLIGCNNCTALTICKSTATTRGGWSSPVVKTTACR